MLVRFPAPTIRKRQSRTCSERKNGCERRKDRFIEAVGRSQGVSQLLIVQKRFPHVSNNDCLGNYYLLYNTHPSRVVSA